MGSLSEQASQVEHGWTVELCAKYDTLAREDHSNTYTTRELQRPVSTYTIHWKTDRWQNDLIMQKRCEPQKRMYQESGEANEKIHRNQQRRQRSHNPVSETSQGSACLDRKTGWKWYWNLHGRLLNPGGLRPAGTNSLVFKNVVGFRFQEVAMPCNRREVRTVHLTRDFLAHLHLSHTSCLAPVWCSLCAS